MNEQKLTLSILSRRTGLRKTILDIQTGNNFPCFSLGKLST